MSTELNEIQTEDWEEELCCSLADFTCLQSDLQWTWKFSTNRFLSRSIFMSSGHDKAQNNNLDQRAKSSSAYRFFPLVSHLNSSSSSTFPPHLNWHHSKLSLSIHCNVSPRSIQDAFVRCLRRWLGVADKCFHFLDFVDSAWRCARLLLRSF